MRRRLFFVNFKKISRIFLEKCCFFLMDFDCFWLKFLIRNKLGSIEEEKRATTGFFVSSAV